MKKIILGILILTILIVKNSFAQTDTTFVFKDYLGLEFSCKGKYLNGKRIGQWTGQKLNSVDHFITKTYFKDGTFEALEYRIREGNNIRSANSPYSKPAYVKYNIIKYNGYIDSLGKDIFHGSYRILWDSYVRKNILIDFKNGKIDGLWIEFSPHNDTINYKTFVNNRVNGLYKEFYYVNSKLPIEGEKNEFDNNIKIIGQFDDLDKVGIWTEFYYNGIIKSKGEYLKNALEIEIQKDDTIKIFTVKDAKGKIIPPKKYKTQIKETIADLINQDYYSSFPFRMNLKNGIWKYWDENGKLIKKKKYRNRKFLKN